MIGTDSLPQDLPVTHHPDTPMTFRIPSLQGRRGGFIGEMIRWFIMVAIYDICIGGIASALGVSRIVACFIFLGILLAISAVGYIVRQRMAPAADD